MRATHLPYANDYSLVTFDVPNATATILRGINDAGVVVGSHFTGVQIPVSVGFIDNKGVITDLPADFFRGGSATDINDKGQVLEVGTNQYTARTNLYDESGSLLQSLPYAFAGRGINDRSEIVGGASPTPSNFDNDPVLYQLKTDVFTPIAVPISPSHTFPTDINDRDQVVGFVTTFTTTGTLVTSMTTHGFLYDNGQFSFIDFPGATDTFVEDINNKGVIVGNYSTDNGYHGFIDYQGNMTTLDFPGATNTFIYGINDHNQIVGGYQDVSGAHGFIGYEHCNVGGLAAILSDPNGGG
jgi:uncharacterized membrane protein